MNRNRWITVLSGISGTFVVILGWTYSAQELQGSGSGAGWMIAASVVATIALGLWGTLTGSGHPLAAAIGFIVVAVSPTVFAYPANIAVLVLGAAQLFVLAHTGGPRRVPPAVRGARRV